MTQLCNLDYQKLNDNVINNMFKKSIFEKWKNNGEESPETGSFRLELIFSPKCNLKCQYCYVNKNNQNIYFNTPWNVEQSLNNVKLLLQWLYDNDYSPELDIFSGELFAQESGFLLLETILDFYKEHNDKPTPPAIIIPTNGTFLKDESLSYRLDNLIKRLRDEVNINVHLSFSFDGLYADSITRQYKCNLDYDLSQEIDQKYYDTLFQYMKDHEFLSHPMLSPENIHVWKENYLWFAEMFEKYNIPLKSMYLLEVRNWNWNKQNISDFVDFINFVMDYWWERTKHDKKEFLDYFMYTNHNEGLCAGNNFLINNFYAPQKGDGASCTFGRHVMVKVSDLTIYPCHRLLYPELKIAHFKLNEQKELILECDNIELGICTYSYSTENHPVCSTCAIQGLCCTPCYGSQYEVTKDLFTPIPTVCCMEYEKLKAIVNKLIEYDIYDDFLNDLSIPHRIKISNFVNNEIKEKK